MTKPKTVRIRSKGQIVIPKAFRDELGLDEDDDLVVFRRGDSLVLMRSDDFAENTRGAAKGVWGATAEEIDTELTAMRDQWA